MALTPDEESQLKTQLLLDRVFAIAFACILLIIGICKLFGF